MRLENEYLKAQFVAKGAQMSSLIFKETNIEVIWPGDSKYWGYHNPTLFPIVGPLTEQTLLLNGQTYKMKQHGFARLFDFRLIASNDVSCTWQLSDNEETFRQFPFHFALTIRYTLKGKRVVIDYTIENHSSETIPFQFGLHPAFNLSYPTSSSLEDFRIEFHPQTDLRFYGDSDVMKSVSFIPLSEAMFEERPTWMFEDVLAPYVSLTDGTHGVKVSCAGYRWLAFWKPLKAPFLCIEPWHGHGDFNQETLPFEEREGTLCLPAGRHWITSYTIEPF